MAEESHFTDESTVELDLQNFESNLRDRMNYHDIPEHMRESVIDYVIYGRPVGHFLHNLFSNDLMGTFSRADTKNRQKIEEWTLLIYNDIPKSCWGSESNVVEWQKVGGLKGKYTEE